MPSLRTTLLWVIYICISISTVILVTFLPIRESISDFDTTLLCDFNSTTTVHSTPRDVVFFFATNFASGLELSIKSLRSTGSECRIILFCAPGFSFSQYFKRLAKELDIEIVKNCVDEKKRHYVPHMIRFEFELQWLEKEMKTSENSINRIFHTDSFDVFFQGDPFSHITDDSLIFVVEPHQIRSCGWNLAWITQCYGGAIASKMSHRFIICSGSIAGDAVNYIKLLKLMIAQTAWSRCYEPSMDQPILNYLVWNGLVDNEGIKYKLTGCDNGFFTVQWCVLEKTPLYNEHGQLISNFKAVPSYNHQYNRIPEMQEKMFTQCHIQMR